MAADPEPQVEEQGQHSAFRHLQRYRRGSLTDDYRTLGGAICRAFSPPSIQWLRQGKYSMSDTFYYFCHTAVLIILKVLLFHNLLQFYSTVLSTAVSGSISPATRYKTLELHAPIVASIIAADILWSNRVILLHLLDTYQTSRKPYFGWRFLLAMSSAIPCVFVYVAKVIRYCPNGLHYCTITAYFSPTVLAGTLGLLHSVAALSIIDVLCQGIEEKLGRIARNIRASRAVLTPENLEELRKQWEHYAFLVQDLCDTFHVFCWLWGCFMLECFVGVAGLAPRWVHDVDFRPYIKKNVVGFVVLIAFSAHVTLYIILTMRTMLQPRRSLRHLSILKSTEHVTLHIDIQKFLYRLDRCPATCFFQIISVLFKSFLGILLLSVLVRVCAIKFMK